MLDADIEARFDAMHALLEELDEELTCLRAEVPRLQATVEAQAARIAELEGGAS